MIRVKKQLHQVFLIGVSLTLLISGIASVPAKDVAAQGGTCNVDYLDNNYPNLATPIGFNFSVSSSVDMQLISISGSSGSVVISDGSSGDWSSTQVSNSQVVFPDNCNKMKGKTQNDYSI